MVWADTIAVGPTLQGVLDALTLKPLAGRLKVPLADGFREHLRTCTRKELYELNRALVDTYPLGSADIPVIKKHLKEHVDDLHSAIQQYG
jgi:hypothetical protein